MCVPPHKYMAPPNEYVESSSDTSDSEEEEVNHNTWNMLLEILMMSGSSPAIQQGLLRLGIMQGGIVMPLRAGHNFLSMERQAGERRRYAQAQYESWWLHTPWRDKQESDCETPKHSVRAAC